MRHPGACAAEGREAKRATTEDSLVAPTSPGWVPWAPAAMPKWTGCSPVAAVVLLPRRLLRVFMLALAAAAPWPGAALAQDEAPALAGFGPALASSEMRLAGTTAENSASNVVTGANSISAGSFANMSGIPVVIQNSGANVLIQNATIVNLQLN